MKNLKFFAVILFVMGMIAASCEGPEGPRGPAGAAGINGTDGNANVMVFGFPGDTMTSSNTSLLFQLPITSTLMDSSLILPYYRDYNWYQAGSMGMSGDYETRYWYRISNQTVSLNIQNPDGSDYTGADVIWDSVRIFVIPASQFYAAEPDVDFANYYEVESYFGQK
ncbi:MAG: collagen-like protein [Bacteroidales bacterium]|nr:collagen-like protein [Bacteroidales bacterium]